MKIENDEDGMAALQDAEAESLLLSLGILTKFRTLPEDQPRTQVVIYTTHSTHHIFARKFSGMSDPKENGYLVMCFAKSRFSKSQFNFVVSELLRDGSQSVERVEGFEESPKLN